MTPTYFPPMDTNDGVYFTHTDTNDVLFYFHWQQLWWELMIILLSLTNSVTYFTPSDINNGTLFIPTYFI